MSTAQLWQRVGAITEKTLELDTSRRSGYLDSACAGDEALRRQVEALIAADREADLFLEVPAAGYLADGLVEHPPGAAPADRTIGPYRMLRRLGAGGLGEVFLAVRADDQYEQQVAIKVLRQRLDSDDAKRRILAERQILARLEHPNIARLYDGGATEDGRPYLVMEHVDGVPIDEHCARRRLSLEARLELFATLCAAVQFAHQRFVVHRDLKPSNILVTGDGTLKLLDFSIAKAIDPRQPAVAETATGGSPMTLAFASPEQIRGEQVTAATDVHGLGIILYRILTGRHPFDVAGKPEHVVAERVCTAEPMPPSEQVRSQAVGVRADPNAPSAEELADHDFVPPAKRLAGDLDAITLKALAKEQGERYASAEQLATDLGRHARRLPIMARPPSFDYRLRKAVLRHRAFCFVAGTVAVLIVTFVLALMAQIRRANTQAAAAQAEHHRAERVALFLEDVFSEADPSRSRGATITAREILEKGVAKIGGGLDTQPELQSRLLETMARAHQSLGLYDEALELFERSLANRRRLGGKGLALTRTLESLAEIHATDNDYETAETLLREALMLRRRAGEHLIPEGLLHSGSLRYDQGDYEAAESQLREALARQQRLTSSEPLTTANILNVLALTLDNQGKREEAETTYRRALELYRRHGGDDHPEVATILHNLGSLLFATGDHDGASELLQEALDRRRRLLGREHPKTTKTLANLSVVLAERGELDAALELARETLAIRRKLFPEDHSQIGHSLYLVAYILEQSGQVAEAEVYYRRSLTAHRRSLPATHPRIAKILFRLGFLINRDARPREAEPLLREALAIRRQSLPEGHVETSRSALELGHSLAELGRSSEAEPLLREGLEGLRGRDPAATHRAVERLAKIYQASGDELRVAELEALLAEPPSSG